MKSNTKRPFLIYHIAAFIIVAIWGSTFVSTKVLIQEGLSPAHIFSYRFALAYLLMVLIAPFWHRSPDSTRVFARSFGDELLMLAIGVTGGSLYFLAENEALRYSAATNVSLIVCSCPLFTMLLWKIVFKDARLNRWLIGGTVCAFIGMTIVVLNGKFVLHLQPIGDLLALAACVSWAVYSLLLKPLMSRYSSFFLTRKVFFYGFVGMLPYYLFNNSSPNFSLLSHTVVWSNLLFLGIVASMLCFLLWTWVLGGIGVITATNYTYVNPVTTIIFAAIVLHEPITPFFICGTFLILMGLYVCSKSKQA